MPDRRPASPDAVPLSPAEIRTLLAPYCFAGPGVPPKGVAPKGVAPKGVAPKGVILAVSGGPDSVTLMRCLAGLEGLPGPAIPVLIATVDHGLRPTSRLEAEQVVAWAGAAGLPARILTWEGEKPATGIQAAARAARYRLLADLARDTGASHILTAHTLDDQAETLLMRAIAGSGLAGLAGMAQARAENGIVLARPFLAVRKARLVATCRAAGWPFIEDPSNRDERFARARLRRILPALEEAGLTPERLARLAGRLARADAALSAQATERLATLTRHHDAGTLRLDGAGLLAESDEIVIRVLAAALARVAPAARPVMLSQVESLAADLAHALGAPGQTLSRNLGGVLVRLAPDGRLTLQPEPPRRR